jgi:hypothetical protein
MIKVYRCHLEYSVASVNIWTYASFLHLPEELNDTPSGPVYRFGVAQYQDVIHINGWSLPTIADKMFHEPSSLHHRACSSGSSEVHVQRIFRLVAVSGFAVSMNVRPYFLF